MNRKYLTVSLVLLSLFNLSMYSNEVHRVLGSEDFRVLEEANGQGPALRSIANTKPYWESYNEWLCFSAEKADLRLSKHELEKLTLVPTLAIWLNENLYEFEVSSNLIDENGKAILHKWAALIEGEISFCVMAAFLQMLEPDRSLWILQSIKTQKGYWHESELE